MKSSEISPTEEPPSQKITIGDVHGGTFSTTEPAATNGSVISVLTDAASLECNATQEPPTVSRDEVTRPDLDVPKQVIVEGHQQPPPLPQQQQQQQSMGVSPAVSSANEERGSTVVTGNLLSAHVQGESRASDPLPVQGAESHSYRDESHSAQEHRSVSEMGVVATPSINHGVIQHEHDREMDDYIRSPEVQNAIVERSPGGRYVRFMEKLGSGASKDVYRAYDTQEGIEVAWNVVNLSGVPKSERNRIVNEVRLLERLHHHNIISFHGSWVNRERQEVNFVTEILSSGTLKSFIQKVQVIRWKIAKRWAVQILNGLAYLHAQDPPVIHRDLKCDNVFINGTSGDLRIGDLGLSTASRGKLLSVLGTPEFMAPDMYEENSYDEKVDIYAFGMCMLEIFTQEIPYSECKNPAQIYKKVTSGEPPEVLKRLQSKHARDFVLLCLGSKDENGNYVRPSAAELLKHPFLVKRANDDDEVVVDPPLRERGAPEVGDTTAPAKKSSSLQGRTEPHLSRDSMPSSRQRPPSTNDEEDGDRFSEMPESETNIRKVKVLMGRGQELKEEEEDAGAQQPASEQQAALLLPPLPPPPPAVSENFVAPTNHMEHPAPVAQPTQLQYLVAAAVIENEEPNARPYANDVLKLVVTLPVEGQEQYVQFDFHLVQDDPIKVAKEMVQELGIPEGAILEISETISGLACAARMKQDRHASRQRQPQHGTHPAGVGQMQGNSQIGVQAQTVTPNTESESAQTFPTNIATNAHAAPDGAVPSQVPALQPNQQNGESVSFSTGTEVAVSQVPVPATQNREAVAYVAGREGTVASHVPAVHQNQEKGEGFPYGGVVRSQGEVGAYGAREVDVVQQNTQPHGTYSYVQHVPNYHVFSETPTSVQSQVSRPPTVPYESPTIGRKVNPAVKQDGAMYSGQPALNHSHPTIGSSVTGFAPRPPQSHLSTVACVSSQIESVDSQGAASSSAAHSLRHPAGGYENTVTRVNKSGSTVDLHEIASQVNGSMLSTSEYDSDIDEEGLNEELRKLDEDFQRNLQRAMKVYDNRMGNLQRSKIEREAQHQKTLEKHEKERVEFEKRMAKEEEQQLRRIEQLQREWDKRREDLAQFKRRQAPGRAVEQVNGAHGAKENSGDQTGVIGQHTGEMTGHLRSASNASSGNHSMFPAGNLEHKQPHDSFSAGIDR